jgi:hypothetical protein
MHPGQQVGMFFYTGFEKLIFGPIFENFGVSQAKIGLKMARKRNLCGKTGVLLVITPDFFH